MNTFSFHAGTTPLITDTEWSLWAKIVIRLSQLTGNSKHLPSIGDSEWELERKALLILDFK